MNSLNHALYYLICLIHQAAIEGISIFDILDLMVDLANGNNKEINNPTLGQIKNHLQELITTIPELKPPLFKNFLDKIPEKDFSDWMQRHKEINKKEQ